MGSPCLCAIDRACPSAFALLFIFLLYSSRQPGRHAFSVRLFLIWLLQHRFRQHVHDGLRFWFVALLQRHLGHTPSHWLLLAEQNEIILQSVDDLFVFPISGLQLGCVIDAAGVINECDLVSLCE